MEDVAKPQEGFSFATLIGPAASLYPRSRATPSQGVSAMTTDIASRLGATLIGAVVQSTGQRPLRRPRRASERCPTAAQIALRDARPLHRLAEPPAGRPRRAGPLCNERGHEDSVSAAARSSGPCCSPVAPTCCSRPTSSTPIGVERPQDRNRNEHRLVRSKRRTGPFSVRALQPNFNLDAIKILYQINL